MSIAGRLLKAKSIGYVAIATLAVLCFVGCKVGGGVTQQKSELPPIPMVAIPTIT